MYVCLGDSYMVPMELGMSQMTLIAEGPNEPAPTNAPWRMDGKWSGNSFLLGSSSLANHGG
jgi:hypothetical protein